MYRNSSLGPITSSLMKMLTLLFWLNLCNTLALQKSVIFPKSRKISHFTTRIPHQRFGTIKRLPLLKDAPVSRKHTSALYYNNNGMSDHRKVEKYNIYGKIKDNHSSKLGENYYVKGKKTIPLDGMNRPLLEIDKVRKSRSLKRVQATILRGIKWNTFDSIFNEIDKDGDGKLSKKEILDFSRLSHRARRLGIQGIKGKTLDSIFNEIDKDGDGKLSKEELLDFSNRSIEWEDFGRPMEETTTSENQFVFLDVNGDGFIDRDEFERYSQAERERRNDINGKKTSNPGSIEEGIEVIEESLEQLAPLERQGFRLEGFSPYVLVSVLTAGECFGVISEYQPDWESLAATTSFAQLTPEDWSTLVLLIIGATSTLMSIYSTVVFSLTVLYGKTAIGLDKDESYYEFLDNTGLQRFRAFKAFTFSLGLFCVIVSLETFLKSPSIVRIPIALATGGFLYFGWKEYNFIIEAAAPIFAPSTTDSSDE